MSNPMYCPLSFNRDAYFANGNKVYNPIECTPDCAWAFKDSSCYEYCCGIALMSFKLAEGARRGLELNWRDY